MSHALFPTSNVSSASHPAGSNGSGRPPSASAKPLILSNGYHVLDLVSISDAASPFKAIERRAPARGSPPLADDVPHPWPPNSPPPNPSSASKGSSLWDSSHPPTMTSYFDGPHFSYDQTSAFNYGTPITPDSYQTLLTDVVLASEINIGRNISFFQWVYLPQSLDLSDTPRWLAPLDLGEQEDQRCIVLSQETSVVLELNFNPGPSIHPLKFDALEIPLTRSVNSAVDRNSRRLLVLRVLLVDAVNHRTLSAREGWYEGNEDDTSALSLVNFQAEHNIIDLHNGQASARFRPPCCFLDSHQYR
jgi:hypothetical protein